MTLSLPARRILYVVIGASAAAAAVATFLLPPDEMLGTLVRLVVFHGAYTWVNMALFTVTGLLSVAYLLMRRETTFVWASAFRRLAVVAWVVNAALGMISAQLSWGSVPLSEPRLQATFVLLFLSGLLLSIDYFIDRDLISAFADVAMAAALWWLILGARNFVHPDSPVMNSGWEIKAPFFAIVGSVAVLAVALAAILAGRIAPERAETRGAGESSHAA